MCRRAWRRLAKLAQEAAEGSDPILREAVAQSLQSLCTRAVQVLQATEGVQDTTQQLALSTVGAAALVSHRLPGCTCCRDRAAVAMMPAAMSAWASSGLHSTVVALLA